MGCFGVLQGQTLRESTKQARGVIAIQQDVPRKVGTSQMSLAGQDCQGAVLLYSIEMCGLNLLSE